MTPIILWFLEFLGIDTLFRRNEAAVRGPLACGGSHVEWLLNLTTEDPCAGEPIPIVGSTVSSGR